MSSAVEAMSWEPWFNCAASAVISVFAWRVHVAAERVRDDAKAVAADRRAFNEQRRAFIRKLELVIA
jgi:hypothetical protein